MKDLTLRIQCQVMLVLTLCLFATFASAQVEWPPDDVEEIPFVAGNLWVPVETLEEWVCDPPYSNAEFANRDIIQHATVIHQKGYEVQLAWNYMEPEQNTTPGQEDNWINSWGEASSAEIANILQWFSDYHPQKSLEFDPYPWIQFAPDWFKETSDYQALTYYQPGGVPATDPTLDMLSPWAPGTLVAVDYFYSWMARLETNNANIDFGDHIIVGLPSNEFAEAGLVLGSQAFSDDPGGDAKFRDLFPLDGDALYKGFWCNDVFAREDFREWAISKYTDIPGVNLAWGQYFQSYSEICFPLDNTHRRYWLDFLYWYSESYTDFTEEAIQEIRDSFNDRVLHVKMGFGGEHPCSGLDRTGMCLRMAEYKPFAMNAMHASWHINFGTPSEPRDVNTSYYWIKRIGPLCHNLGIGLAMEIAGGILSEEDANRQFFDFACSGVNYHKSYYSSFNANEDLEKFKDTMRPWERSLVDIAILYPNTQMYLDARLPNPQESMSDYNYNHCSVYYAYNSDLDEYQPEFCENIRDYLDYDMVDERILQLEMFDDYKVLINTSGIVFEQNSLSAIDTWIRNGGLFIDLMQATNSLENVEGLTTTINSWTSATQKVMNGHTYYEVDQGSYVRASDMDDVVAILSEAHVLLPQLRKIDGFDGKGDGIYKTEFERGMMVYDTQTGITTFIDQDVDFDQAFDDANFLVSGLNYNGNLIEDEDELALLSSILADKDLYQHRAVSEAFQQNYLQMSQDATVFGSWYEDEASVLILAAFMTLGDDASVNFVVGLQSFDLHLADYDLTQESVLSDFGDADNDGWLNKREYDVSSNRMDYLREALEPDFWRVVKYLLQIAPNTVDGNLNGMSDWKEFQLISAILSSPVLYQHPEVKNAWNANWLHMLSDIDPAIEKHKVWTTMLAAYMTLGDSASQQAVAGLLDPAVFNVTNYFGMKALLAWNGDADLDTLINKDEYLLVNNATEYLRVVLIPDYDVVLSTLGTSQDSDKNGSELYGSAPNGIPDSDEFALLTHILGDNGIAQHEDVKTAWNENIVKMIADTSNTFMDNLRYQRIIYATGFMTLGDIDSQNMAITHIVNWSNPSVVLNPGDYNTSQSTVLAFYADPDLDGLDNLDEHGEAVIDAPTSEDVRSYFLDYVFDSANNPLD